MKVIKNIDVVEKSKIISFMYRTKCAPKNTCISCVLLCASF